MDAAELRRYRRDGFVVRRRAFDPAPLAAALARLGAAGTVQHLPAALLPEPEPEVALARLGAWVGGAVAPAAASACGGRPLRHSTLSLLGTQPGYRQHWHKECHWWHSGIRPGSVDEVAAGEICHGRHVQINAPLLHPDASLHVVPGSHARGTTPLEREAATATLAGDHAFAEANAAAIGGTAIALEPGDICIFDMHLVHRGWNPDGQPRL